LASINYMNLTNARAGQRVREVGVRKVLGAGRKHLLGQLMTESFIITLGSFMLGAGLAYLLIPAFSQLLDQSISLLPTNDRLLPAGLLLLGVVLSSLAGLYPAFLSAGVHPVQALKGYFFKHRKDGTFLRNALVVGQFTAAIVLAISSVVIYQQLRFVQNKKLGFSRDQILYVPYRDLNLYDQASAIRSELLKHPRIRQVSIANNLPVDLTSDNLVNRWEGNTDGRELSIYRNRVDYYFLDLYEIELVEGRNFSPEFPSDTRDRYLLNETAVKTLGWESAVGKSFKDGEVIGVVKDFHFHKLDQTIKPLFLTMPDPDYSYWGFFAMKVGSENMQETISYVQETLKRFVPQLIFEHGFVDENYQRLYDAEKRFGHVFNIFTLIALLIACMGLLGLVTHNVLQRTKEIGIRKILGSSIAGIVQLISGDFIRLVLIAAFIAVPVSWWGMHHWLEHFAYRIDLDWWVFVAVGILAIGLAFLTVSTQAVRAAAANPVDSLKAE
ncbi:MAG: FtsX-like permease family protein, partial [Lewinella sp.]|nr:FtsX-like permease family protein [Lewinella sp.]